MIPENYQNASDAVKQLFSLGSPQDRNALREDDWDDHLAQGFTNADIPILLKLVLDSTKFYKESEDDEAFWGCVYAWRTLGQLNIEPNDDTAEVVATLIFLMTMANGNDWIMLEVPSVLAMIGDPSVVPLYDILMVEGGDELTKSLASDSLLKIAQNHPDLKDTVVGFYRKYLEPAIDNDPSLNALVICCAMDLEATDLIPEIRDLFDAEAVDMSITGDWEDVEISMGLREERDTPRPNYNEFDNMELDQLLEDLSDDELIDLAGDLYDENDPIFAQTASQKKSPKIGRNDPCPCGSGKKYKKCCLN